MKYIILAILLGIFILLFLPVKFNINYINHCGSGKLDITTSYFFGLFKPEIYPFDKKKRERPSKPKIYTTFPYITRDLQYKKFIDYIWDRLVIERVDWETEIGFEDAVLTVLVYGLVWQIKSILMVFVLSDKEINKINIDVITLFNENEFNTKFNCIIKIRIVYIIIVWIWLLKWYKGGEKIDRTSNRRANENYNG